ncbi:MAG: RNA-binding protein [Symploca sp. SIO3C6]|uniref:RNA-binding protein n=1 Tax=Symploca sp. SIO1C4 TaxID=2607765 RepID=A0A6B3NER9_9CYAN|nr:RNA-binding protein [Symploca sp. SIO3C6]NER29425.1 RNA-binding protein [Symploca sp. SIO1C4]NET05270.1 RNA-binding protein [Symploca sp. SIO2B6]NET49715.1 RNA-binding protein [Merismopedia sp. SIO2A8]
MMSNQSMQQRGQQWLEKLLSLSNLPAGVEVTDKTEPHDDRPSYWLTIEDTKLTPEQIQILIGLKGSVIDAIQYLANSIINLDQDQQQQAAYTIELDGYRARRQAQLQTLAAHAAEQVRETGEAFELKSLSSAERRQIHTFLKECDDLETHSQGQEPDRRLVVRRR